MSRSTAGNSMDELLNAEFKEAFNEFDKESFVDNVDFIKTLKNPIAGRQRINLHQRVTGSDEVDGSKPNRGRVTCSSPLLKIDK